MNARRFGSGSRVALCVAVVGIASAARADFAPPEYRGAARSAWIEWEFLLPPCDYEALFPDWTSFVGGGSLSMEVQTHAQVGSCQQWRWVPEDLDGGIGPAADATDRQISFIVQNWTAQVPATFLRVQMSWLGDLPPVVLRTEGSDLGGEAVLFKQIRRVEIDDHHFYEDWVAYPSPVHESVVFDVPEGTVIDEVTIDTWATVPTPAGSLALIGAAIVLLSVRHR